MFDIENLLYSFERKQKTTQRRDLLLLEQNIESLYKNKTVLLESNLKHILSINSISQYKELYVQFSTQSKNKLCIYSKIQKEIAKQKVNKKERTLDLGAIFLQKVSLYFQERLCQSRRYQNLKHIIQDEHLFLKDLIQQFKSQVQKISYRTLVFDFHLSKQNKSVLGRTEKEQLINYNQKMLMDEQFVLDFFNRYPCLLRSISNEMRKSKKIILELFDRYEKDKVVIAKNTLRVDIISKVKKIKLGLGDPHCDGRRAIAIQLEHGKIMYKPRDSSPEFFYSMLINKWNSVIKDPNYVIKVPKGIYKEEYSWIEYIPFNECKYTIDIHSFYKRMGVQMAFLYALNATDLHFENIIAHGSHPVLIDLECLFSIPLSNRNPSNILGAHYKIQNQIARSICSIGLLPTSNEPTKDISGIGTGMSNKIVVKSPQITKNDQTEIKIKNLDLNYTMFKPNQPKFKGKKILVSNYIDDILQGFEKAYQYIEQDKVQFIREISNQKLHVRYLAKSTNKYTSTLDLSYHPRFLHHAMDRELFLLKACEPLNRSNHNISIQKNEFRELLNGDIPYFTVDIHAKDLIASNHKRIKKVFSYSPFHYVCEKIKTFCTNDLNFQMEIIRMSFLTSHAEKKTVQKQAVPLKKSIQKFQQKDFCITKAKEIGDYLFSIATTGTNFEKRNICWLQSSAKTENTKILKVMDDTLYDGITGMAVMYLLLWRVTKDYKYLRIAEDMMEDMMCRFQSNQLHLPSHSIGAFSGISSILYASLSFYFYTQNEKYILFSYAMIEDISNLLQLDRHYDIIGGVAGLLLVLIKFYEITRDQDILEVAKSCGNFLINQAIHINNNEVGWKGISQKLLTGFSHGNAGIIFALQRLYTYNKDEEIVNIIRKALSFENNNKVNTFWIDLRKSNKQIDAMTWCHGSPGILLSRLELQKSIHVSFSQQIQLDITFALSNILQHGFHNDNSLCHGRIGNILILLQYARRVHDKKLQKASQNLICEIVKEMRFESENPLNPRENIGIMTGLAGVVYALLYVCDDTLPNIMTLG
ncbi:type 2 lantibiotic biosynthesis protein LanM [Bacillus cereus VD196]|uniref:Type 2 lantibiotic biosynthesis protein LanM n=1 Tax=Bacillus cereus VD196 TaxID=1053243 RepID=A0A9W5V5N7_BACCE|nr:type 2 lanthipeptide synthetase LanM family protein [Bacillus cereus]EOO58623.1 type 2 lantibiotic biosynthesis protein LanM [Bacillus cereus VD196]